MLKCVWGTFEGMFEGMFQIMKIICICLTHLRSGNLKRWLQESHRLHNVFCRFLRIRFGVVSRFNSASCIVSTTRVVNICCASGLRNNIDRIRVCWTFCTQINVPNWVLRFLCLLKQRFAKQKTSVLRTVHKHKTWPYIANTTHRSK